MKAYLLRMPIGSPLYRSSRLVCRKNSVRVVTSVVTASASNISWSHATLLSVHQNFAKDKTSDGATLVVKLTPHFKTTPRNGGTEPLSRLKGSIHSFFTRSHTLPDSNIRPEAVHKHGFRPVARI